MIAGDGALNWPSNSPDYYQSSNVISSRDLDFRNLRVYKFSFSKSNGKTSFPIFVVYKSVKEILTIQIKMVLRLYEFLHQKINSFLKQAVFVNEMIHSDNFNTSLYTA